MSCELCSGHVMMARTKFDQTMVVNLQVRIQEKQPH